MTNTDSLISKSCEPCEGGVPPLEPEAAEKLLTALGDGWAILDDGKTIRRKIEFKAWGRTMGFVNAVAWVATVEGHHPDLEVSYGHCVVNYTTHAIGGLSENDFICAAKIDRLFT